MAVPLSSFWPLNPPMVSDQYWAWVAPAPVWLYIRSRLKQTALASRSVPSLNLTPWRILKVQVRPSDDASQDSAKSGSTSAVPGLKPTRPSIICRTTRNVSPSVAYSGSSTDGAPAAPKVKVWSVSPPPPPLDGAADPVSLPGALSLADPVAAPVSVALAAVVAAVVAAAVFVVVLLSRSELAHAASETATVAASPATNQR